MNKVRREELTRIAVVMKALANNIADVLDEEERINKRMAINTPNYSVSELSILDLDSAYASALDALDSIVAAINN